MTTRPSPTSQEPIDPQAHRRIGAYRLAGDPVWMASSLSRYYPYVDELVVTAPASRRGWTGKPIPVDECLRIVERVDTRGIRRVVLGEWEDHKEPMRAETAQRRAGIDALGDRVDWVLQIDNDELLPSPDALFDMLDEAEKRSISAVEWPMRVLFRRLRSGAYLEVCAETGSPRYDYPGPVAVRAGSRAVEARRCSGVFLRPVVQGDTNSLEIRRPAAEREARVEGLRPDQAIVHNSWGREPAEIRRKIRTWGHAAGLKTQVYYWRYWFPAPLVWWWIRDFHPFSGGLWPRLTRVDAIRELLVDPDR